MGNVVPIASVCGGKKGNSLDVAQFDLCQRACLLDHAPWPLQSSCHKIVTRHRTFPPSGFCQRVDVSRAQGMTEHIPLGAGERDRRCLGYGNFMWLAGAALIQCRGQPHRPGARDQLVTQATTIPTRMTTTAKAIQCSIGMSPNVICFVSQSPTQASFARQGTVPPGKPSDGPYRATATPLPGRWPGTRTATYVESS